MLGIRANGCGGGSLARDAGVAREARLGGASGVLDARLAEGGGGGGTFELELRATTPDSDSFESRLLSESKMSSPEPLVLRLME